MASVDAAPKQHTGDVVATILLLTGQLMLVVFTLVMLVGINGDEQYTEARCRYHNLECSHSARDVAAWIALGGSTLLLIIGLVLGIRRMVTRRLAFYVPLLCCIGQVVSFVALVMYSTAH